MVFPIVGGDGKPTGYEISNSVRYNDDDSPQLSRSMSSGNQQIFTLSTWLKRANISNGNQRIFSSDDEASADFRLRFIAADTLEFTDSYTGNSSTYTEVYTKRKFRDVSAWYHIVLAVDTTQGTAANRVKIYINGVEETDLDNGSGGSTKYPSQNDNLGFGRNGKTLEVGASLYSSSPRQSVDMYLAETYAVDGAQLTPNYFGEFNDNNVWIPVEPGTGAGGSITYGTNGFLLEYKQTGTSANSSGIGADTSGNDNHFTPTNLTATDITTDTPTNNFCTFNPIFTGQRGTFSEGNTKLVTSVQGSVNYGQSVIGTFLLTSGKWYWEIEVDAVGSGGNVGIGVNERIDAGIYNNGHNNLGSTGTAFYKSDGNIQIGGGSNISNTSYTSGDIISVALDLDNSRIYWAKNGVYQSNGSGTGNPSTGANPVTLTSSYDDGWVVFCSKDDTNNNATFIANFGNYPVAVSSGNADANGYGNFEYAVPSGFYSLCTKNLAEYG